jgi:hypothetical protein
VKFKASDVRLAVKVRTCHSLSVVVHSKMKWNFEDTILKRDDFQIMEFDSPIKKIVEFDKCAVILLSRDYYVVDNENVFCVSNSGKMLWQVPKYEYIYDVSRFVDISKEAQNVKLWNWDSSWIIIEPLSGEIIMTPLESRKGRRPW